MIFINRTPSHDSVAGIQPNRLERATTSEVPTIMLEVRSEVLPNGSMHKMKLKPVQSHPKPLPTRTKNPKTPRTSPDLESLCKVPSRTSVDLLAQNLVDSLHHQRPGLELSAFSKYFGLLPARLESSAALYDTLRCLVSAHQSALRGVCLNDCLDHNLYGRALKSIQKAIQDQTEYLTAPTLSAVSLISRLESVVRCAPNPCFAPYLDTRWKETMCYDGVYLIPDPFSSVIVFPRPQPRGRTNDAHQWLSQISTRIRRPYRRRRPRRQRGAR